nr:beta-galactosidase [Bowdeniella massiliensis]
MDPGPIAAQTDTTPSTAEHYPKAAIEFPGNDGKPHTVDFDKHSFMVDGQRLNIWSGEIHHWRIPDPNAWRDLFQKMRANGYNAVSLYFFWGLHQAEKGGDFDFSPGSIKDLDLLLTMAAEEGLYVIARPGPYVNAEISMGGLPAWMTNEAGRLRSTDPAVLQASKDWLSAFNQIAKKHLITNGGGSIIMYQVENELLDESQGRDTFLRELATFVRADGIDVPLFHNDYALGGRFKDIGKVGTDFYAYDSYPVGFNCSAPRNQIADSETQFRSFAPDSPHFITESQGGAFTPWGASYNASDCYTYTDEAFTRQWGVNNIGNGVTAFNFYMAFGGTNWGWTGSPSSGFTSYDYGAGITEDRVLTAKAGVQKEIGYYQKAVPELAQMDPGKNPKLSDSGSGVRAYMRQAVTADGSATGHGVRSIALRLKDSNATTTTSFTMPLILGVADSAETASFSHDDRDPAITYSGSWTDVSDGTASRGTLKRSEKAGDTATLTFTGTGARLIIGTGTDHGDFTVQIDDGEPVTVTKGHVDTEQNKPAQVEAYAVSGLSAGEHTITVKNAGTQGSVVSLDAFDVSSNINQPVEINNSQTDVITYNGSWEHASGKPWTAGDIGGDESFSKTAGDTYSFSFTGVGFDLIAPFSENHGSATVSVDGTVVGTTKETVTTGAQPQQVVHSWRAPEGAEPAEHVVTVTVDGTPFEGSSDTFVSLDAVRYFPTRASLTPRREGPKEGEIGWAKVPQKEGTALVIDGRDGIVLTADKKIAGHDLYYTTSQLFGAPLATEAGHTQYLVAATDADGETVLHYKTRPQVTGDVEQTWDGETGQLRLNYTHRTRPYEVRIDDGSTPLTLRIIDRPAAVTTWLIDGMKDGSLVTTAIEGVELTRTAHYDGTTLALTGSASKAGDIRVLAPAGTSTVTWNGKDLADVSQGVAKGEIPGPSDVAPITLQFVSAPDHRESEVDFNDSHWQRANDTAAANPDKQGPGSSQGVVLDSNHYGKYEGSVWYRAHYTAASDDPTLTFIGNGGSGVPSQGKNPAFMQVWVNGTYAGALPAAGTAQSLSAPKGSVTKGQPVVVAVLVHNLGQNLDWSDDGLSKQNRGLFDASLNSTGEVTWRIMGAMTAGAAASALNPSGTLYNNGGLGGEFAGWHTPQFDDHSWKPADSLHSPAGVTWYRAHTRLDVPVGQDTAFRLEINSERAPHSDGSQATILVNGWNTGVYIGDIGPQTSFTIPSGFLNPRGENVIAIAVAAKDDGMGPESVTLRAVHSTTLPGTSGIEPDPEPSETPTSTPSPDPSATVTQEPTWSPTSTPTAEPSAAPTDAPSSRPSADAPGDLPITGVRGTSALAGLAVLALGAAGGVLFWRARRAQP